MDSVVYGRNAKIYCWDLFCRFRLIKREVVNTLVKKSKMGDWFLFYMLGQNVDSMIFKEVFFLNLSFSSPVLRIMWNKNRSVVAKTVLRKMCSFLWTIKVKNELSNFIQLLSFSNNISEIKFVGSSGPRFDFTIRINDAVWAGWSAFITFKIKLQNVQDLPCFSPTQVT